MRPALINFELLYQEDVLAGNAINIVSKNNISVRRKKLTGVENGIFTKELGSITNLEEEILEYSCDCGHTNSRMFEGTICPECGTECIERFAVDINRFGWIDLGNYKVMTPNGFEFVKKVIGGTALDRIINYNVSLDLDGNIITYDDRKKPYANTGLMDFYKRFDDIIRFFGQKKKEVEYAEFVIKMKKRIFTSKIPVISQFLRPAFVSNKTESVSYDRLNMPYSAIITNVDLLKKYDESDKVSINHILYTIQTEWQSLYNYIINRKIKGKKQIVRGQIQGSRMNYTARHIITANTRPDFDIDNVIVSYNCFVRLYKLEIINTLKRGYIAQHFVDMTLYEIRDYVDLAEFKNYIDEYIYAAIKFLLKNHKTGFYCLCIRPPSLDMGSVQCVRITDVLNNIDAKMLQVPLTSLTPWNGDFDGDALLLFAIKEKCLVEAFKALSPKRLILNRSETSKMYNSAFGFVKDMGVPLYDFIRPYGVLVPDKTGENDG